MASLLVYCTTAEVAVTNDVAWSTLSNLTNQSSSANIILNATQSSDTIRGVNFDFTAIPAGSTIDGVRAYFYRYGLGNATDTASWELPKLNMPDDSASAAASFPVPDAWVYYITTPPSSYCGTTSYLWGETLTVADVQDVDFGIRFGIVTKAGQLATAEINSVALEVSYTSETVTATGTITTADETDITDGGQTILLTLSNTTWATAGATFDAQRQGIINGITATATPDTGLGWDDEVTPNMSVSRVVRTNPTQVTITLNAAECAGYNPLANETLSVTVPASAHSGTGALTDNNFATITAYSDQFLPPTSIITQTALSGAVTDIDENIGSPDGLWLTLSAAL